MMKKYIATTLLFIIIGAFSGCGTSENKDIGKDKALQIALEDAEVTESNVSSLHVSRESDDGNIIYEISFTDTISEAAYDYEILAYDGTIQKVDRVNSGGQANSGQQVNSNQQTNSSEETNTQVESKQTSGKQKDSQNQANKQNNSQAQVTVSLEKATNLALNRVSGATENDIRIKLDYDDGYYVYEGEILYGQKEYEFEIDANTGTFLEWSEEKR